MASPWETKTGTEEKEKKKHNLYFIILLKDFQETIQTRDDKHTDHVGHERMNKYICEGPQVEAGVVMSTHPSVC